MAHTTFTKDQIAHTLGIQTYMLAAWEKQFDVSPLIENDVETYTSEHLETFKKIKELLYDKGMTLTAAKKALLDKTSTLEEAHVAASSLFFEPSRKASGTFNISNAPEPKNPHILTDKLLHIQSQLKKIRSTL